MKYEVPWLLVHEAAAASPTGLGDSLAGVKWRFYDPGEPRGWQISTYPQYAFNSPDRADERGLVAPGAHWVLPLEFQRSVGSFDVNYEIGRTLRTQGAAEDVWFSGVVVGRKLTPRREAMLRLQATAARSFDRNGILLNSGLRYILSRPITLLAAAGSGIEGNERPAWLGYIGLQFASQ